MKTTMQNQTISARTLEPNEKHRAEDGNVNGNSFGKISFERRRANRALATWEVIDLLRKEAPELFEIAQVVGTWVWVSFQERQPASVTGLLAELGFTGTSADSSGNTLAGLKPAERKDPREKYSTYFAADRKSA